MLRRLLFRFPSYRQLSKFSSLSQNKNYLLALKYFAENKLQLAETQLLDMRTEAQNSVSKQLSPPETVELLKMLAYIQEQSGKGQELMQTQEELFFLNFSQISFFNDDQQTLLRGLFKTYIKLNEKQRCHALIEMLKEQKIPLKYDNELLALEGVLCLVNKNNLKAADLLKQSIESGIKDKVLCAAQNNYGYALTLLAIEQLEKNPIQSLSTFKEAQNMLIDAIQLSECKLENTESIEETEKEKALAELCLNFFCEQTKSDTPQLGKMEKQLPAINISEQKTYTSIMNLSEVLIRQGKFELSQMWLKLLIKSSLKSEVKSIQRAFLNLGLSTVQNPQLQETIFLDLLESNKSNHYVQMNTLAQYSELLKLQNRHYEADAYNSQSYQIFQMLDQHQIVLEHVIFL